MSSRSRRRRRNAEAGHDTAGRSALVRRPGARRKLGLFFLPLAMAIAGVVWIGARFLSRPEAREGAIVALENSPTNRTAASLHDSGHKGSEAFSSLVNHGNQLLADGKPEEALQVLTEAMRLNPDDEDVHYDLALVLTRLGKVDDAIREYREALRLYPQYVEAHNNLGNLLMRSGKTEEAVQHFETALQTSPDYASAHNNLGTALQQLGRSNEAIVHFERAATINPDYWQAHFNVGTSCLQAGRLSEARTQLQAVLRLKPDFQPAQGALDEVESRQAALGSE